MYLKVYCKDVYYSVIYSSKRSKRLFDYKILIMVNCYDGMLCSNGIEKDLITWKEMYDLQFDKMVGDEILQVMRLNLNIFVCLYI